MRLLLSAAVALTAPPAVATANAGVVPVEVSAANWVRQQNRNSVRGQRGFYRTSFETNSAIYELETLMPNEAQHGYTCLLRSVGTNDPIQNADDSVSASPFFGALAGIADASIGALDNSIAIDAMTFKAAVAFLDWTPSVWSDEGETVFEWIKDGKHAIVSIEGDGQLGYTILVDGEFKAGEHAEASVHEVPSDLLEYLTTA